jgi:hypothetical protein
MPSPTTSNHETDAQPTDSSPAVVVGIGLIVLAIILLVWRSSLDGSFHFDDYGNIFNRSETDQLWPLTEYLTNNRPVGLYSLAVSRHFCGKSTYGYHLFNLAVHATNAMLLYAGILLSRQVWQRSRIDRSGVPPFWLAIAALVALFWAIHPLTTQAVTYIVQRYESMAAMGYLGAWVGLLLVLVSQKRKERLLGYAIIFVFAWIGLMSKEVFATAPLSIFLFDRQISRQRFRELFTRRWPAYALMLSPFCWFVPSVSRWFDTSRETSMGLGMKEVNSWEYLRTQPEVILHYLKLTVWPHPQSIDYVWRIQQQPAV